MNFAQVDPTISSWSARNNIPLATRYQDTEVRSFQLVGPAGRAQLWVEVNGRICVQVWDYRKRRQTLTATPTTLAAALDQALALARTWV
jgi:hypothetical protein